MNAKTFIFAVAAVVVLGFIIGGAFISGVALGRTQAEPEAQPAFPQAPSAQAGLAGGSGGQVDQAQIQQLRQRAESGEITPEEMQQIRAQIAQTGGGVGGEVLTAAPADAGGRTMGTVKSVKDGVMTVETFQGTVTVNVGADTTIQGLTEVPLSDVQVDSMAVVVGESTESGELDASSVIVLPEGVLPGAEGFRRAGAGFGGAGGGGH